ncbi:MAG: hypothetical protein ACLGGV_06805 [Bacteroidia bacterium]
MKYVSLFLIATTKFLLAPTSGIALGFLPWESLTICIFGGFTGVLVYYNLARFLMRKALEKRLKNIKEGKARKKNFTRINKTLVKLKRSPFGLFVIAFITPVLISIPVGSIVCAKFYKHNKLTIPLLMLSVVFWGFVLTFFSDFIL